MPSIPRSYLDAATVAPVRPEARQAWLAALDDGWADPRRLHREGRRARLLLDGAREALSGLLGVRPDELAVLPSHAAALHAAIAGAATGRRRVGDVVVASAVEHSAVLHAADAAGSRVTVPVDRLGRVDAAAFGAAIAGPGVVLGCLQAFNAEVGTTQPVGEVHEAAATAGVPLLVDCAGWPGGQPAPHAFDLLVADPRGWGSPAGCALLAIRAGVRWRSPGPMDDAAAGAPLGEPGSVDLPAVLAAAVALSVARERADEEERLRALVARLRTRVAQEVPDVEVVGDPVDRLPHVATFSVLYASGEALVGELDERGFAVGSGSACTASTLEPSHVLAAMGVLTHGNVRVGLHGGVDAGTVERFCDGLPADVERVRSMLGARGL